MMAILLVSAIFLFAMILQVAIISDIHLIQGTADLLLLIYITWSINKKTKFNIELALIAGMLVSFVTAIPYYIVIPAYIAVFILNRIIILKFFDISILKTAISILISTLGYLGLSYVYLWIIKGTTITIPDAFGMVIVPSMLMNIVFALPVFAVMREVIALIYPEYNEE
jgi:cell shape-determining protein MreD